MKLNEVRGKAIFYATDPVSGRTSWNLSAGVMLRGCYLQNTYAPALNFHALLSQGTREVKLALV
jgi:hypothetical protein